MIGTNLINEKHLRFNIDKSQISIPQAHGERFYRGNNEWEFLSKNIQGIAEDIAGRINGTVEGDYWAEKPWRRMKRITYDSGLVDVFYDRDFSKAGRSNVYNLASVRFTSDDKVDYRGSYQARLEADTVLSDYALGFHIYEAEMPIDTLDPETGQALRRYGVLNRWRGEARRGVDDGDRPIEQGFNQDGNRCYQNGRQFSKDCLAYEKELGNLTIYRFEPTYRRQYLRPRKIDNHQDLLDNAGRIVSDTLCLKVPKVPKIQKYLRSLSAGKKSWLTRYLGALGLTEAVITDPSVELPAMGWVHILASGAGLDKAKDRTKYFETYSFPEVSLCV